jgi:hypothetical protein
VPTVAAPPPPPEPEIELLRRGARVALITLRVAFLLAGALMLYTGMFGPPAWTGLDWPTTHLFVFACGGLPLVLPCAWWLGPGRWPALVLGCLMWFLPMLRDTDDPYSYLLRLFATMVACASMVVWRTLWRLSAPPVSPGRP